MRQLRKTTTTILIIGVILLFVYPVKAGFWDNIGGIIKGASTHTGIGNATKDALTDSDIAAGLKEALMVAAKRAVEATGKTGGFLNNPSIRIPLPSKLQAVAGVLRTVGMGSQVDEFERSMNTAAEKAAREALPVFSKAVKELTLEDVKKIWKGGDTAATDYFREKTWPILYQRFKPIVETSIQEVGVTKKYQALTSAPAAQSLIQGTSLDLPNYVTEKSLNGLFTVLGKEEARIRKDPVARTTDILKRVFGNS